MKLPVRILLLVWLVSMAACTTKLPILAVWVSDDDGLNRAPITAAEIREWIRHANTTWDDWGYEVTWDEEDVGYIHSTVLNNQPPATNDAAWEMYQIAGNFFAEAQPRHLIPVYFRQGGGAGWSWGPPDTKFVSMPSYTNTCISKPTPGKPCPADCCPNDTLLSHELGHYFGLAHTFTGVACDRVTKDNTDGDVNGQLADPADDILDTPPDPGAACAPTQTLACPGGPIPVNGVRFEPPWQNFMSYHDCLPERISVDQIKAIERAMKSAWRPLN